MQAALACREGTALRPAMGPAPFWSPRTYNRARGPVQWRHWRPQLLLLLQRLLLLSLLQLARCLLLLPLLAGRPLLLQQAEDLLLLFLLLLHNL